VTAFFASSHYLTVWGAVPGVTHPAPLLQLVVCWVLVAPQDIKHIESNRIESVGLAAAVTLHRPAAMTDCCLTQLMISALHVSLTVASVCMERRGFAGKCRKQKLLEPWLYSL